MAKTGDGTSMSTEAERTVAEFTVDTHIFRELGQLLVGRDSTALVELIKNSYDADATFVTVIGERLDSLEEGTISIIDNGTGIALDEFANSFLRIASRSKTEGKRRSRVYQRRFTGAKGIGRLAAHKLARILEVHSIPARGGRKRDLKGVQARIDWDAVEAQETLEDVARTGAVSVVPIDLSRSTQPGTHIALSRLRRRWSADERGRFMAEVQTFEPARILVEPLPKAVTSLPMLVERIAYRDVSRDDPGFLVALEGDFEAGEQYWPDIAQTAAWIIEIDARRDEQLVNYLITPTSHTLESFPEARQHKLTIQHPDPSAGPFFQARILVREGGLKLLGREARAWARRAAGIRVYLEGFRVLPYGEPRNDWLDINSDYTARQRNLPWLAEEPIESVYEEGDAGLSLLPNDSYFGAVCLTEENATTLRVLVNREGFEPSQDFQTVVDLVRAGTDLSVRIRAATTRSSRSERRLTRVTGSDQSPARPSARQTMQLSLDRATSLASTARQLIASGEVESATDVIVDALSEFESVKRESEELISAESMIRVLASVGTQLAVFTHEVNGLLAMAQSVEAAVGRLRASQALQGDARRELARVSSILGDLRRSLEYQASYLVAIISPDARRRRSRQSFKDRFDAARRLIYPSANARRILVSNEIPAELRSPPVFQAELVAVFANLLTNAVKAAGEKGRIRALGTNLPDGRIQITIENTGEAVEPSFGEVWFRPFESTTINVDPLLGQGLGLGLPITRNILEEYGATIRFVKPSVGFATALEILFPG